MEYMTVKEASEKWSISDRRIRVLCSEGRIEGIEKKGHSYLIPYDTIKPVDGRTLKGKDILEKHQALFARIDAKKAEVGKRCSLMEAELLPLEEEFSVAFTYNSLALDGNTLTYSETAAILNGDAVKNKSMKEHLEAIGHKDALDYIKELVQNQTRLSETVIKELQSLVLTDQRELRGVYRREQAEIPGAENDLSEPYLIPVLMQWLVKGHLGGTGRMHVLEAATRFHMDFEGIHPFVDGNGRTGRLLLNFGLMQAGYLPICIRYEDKETYYEAFRKYHEEKDADEMIYLIAGYVETELDRYLNSLC